MIRLRGISNISPFDEMRGLLTRGREAGKDVNRNIAPAGDAVPRLSVS